MTTFICRLSDRYSYGLDSYVNYLLIYLRPWLVCSWSNYCVNLSQMKTPTWCNTVQVLFLQGHYLHSVASSWCFHLTYTMMHGITKLKCVNFFVPDSLAILTRLFSLTDCMTPICPTSWIVTILQYGGRAQF